MNRVSDTLTAVAATPISFLTTINNKSLYIKKDYLNHTAIQGNKLRKLKYNLLAATKARQTVISFGGAFSNHIAALAAAGQEFGIPTVGIIRGDELIDSSRWGSTLHKADASGMKLHFVSRKIYREKQSHPAIQNIIDQYSNYLLVPEGGSNYLSVKGTKEIIKEIACYEKVPFDCILAASGTGGTLAGIIDGVFEYKLSCRVHGIAVVQDYEGICCTIHNLSCAQNDIKWDINDNYHFGGYAKINDDLAQFQADFESQHGVPLDPVYTAKLCYAAFDLALHSDPKKHENWLLYHSGGLQGRS